MLSIVMPILDNHDVIHDMTQFAIDKVAEYTRDYELILVLNGPCRNGWKMSEDVTALGLPETVSISTAYNIGFEHTEGDYLCCLHNDAWVTPGWDVPLIEEASKGNIAFPWVDESTSNCEKYGIGKIKDYQPPGCCFVMSRELWDRVGPYDEQFKQMHWEDMDLFIRARRSGARLKRVPTSVVSHGRGGTRRYVPDLGINALIKNRAKWILKNKSYAKDGTFYYALLDEYEDSVPGYKEYVNGLSA